MHLGLFAVGWRTALVVACAAWLALPAAAANYPCSGRKGGVSHCQGALFVCNDGSISGSKKVCSAEGGGGASRALGLVSPTAPVQGGGDASGCSCRSGNICTGPRGGRYCITDGGHKSYVRR